MGQAKLRCSFEQRKAAAIIKKLEEEKIKEELYKNRKDKINKPLASIVGMMAIALSNSNL